MSIFEEIYRSSRTCTAAGSRKRYLARLFGRLIRIATGRLAARETHMNDFHQQANVAAETSDLNHATAMNKSTATAYESEPSYAFDQWTGGQESGLLDLQPIQATEDQRQLEQILDEYVSHLVHGEGQWRQAQASG
jgi:hypothetical protein